MEKIAPGDLAFLNAETREMSQHIGGVMILRPPAGTESNFVRDLFVWLRRFPSNRAPFNQVPTQAPKVLARPAAKRQFVWTALAPQDINLDEHVRLWGLPRPGALQDLAELVARLHEPLLDRSKPLWEYNVIDGLEDGRVAIYTKLHHSLMDGMGGVSLWDMAQSAEEMDVPPIWHSASLTRTTPKKRTTPLFDQLERYKSTVAKAKAAPELAAYVRDLAAPPIKGAFDNLYGPFAAPRTMLNGKVTARRAYGMASVSFQDCRAIAKATGTSVNDVFLALCGGALRKYLAARDDLPGDAPLIASVPVAIERQADARNAATALFASLGTHVEGALERLQAVSQSTGAAKKRLRDLQPDALQLYAAITLAGMPLLSYGGKYLEGTAKQMMSVVISSLPGPPRSYLRGAELESVYATSLLAAGTALNVTILSYADKATFGLITCPDTVPEVMEIAGAIEDAYRELEAAVLGVSHAGSSGTLGDRTGAAGKNAANGGVRADAVLPGPSEAAGAEAGSAAKAAGTRSSKKTRVSGRRRDPESTPPSPKPGRSTAKSKSAN